MSTAITIAIMLTSLLVIGAVAWILGRRDQRQSAAATVERARIVVESAEEDEIARANKLTLEELLKEVERK